MQCSVTYRQQRRLPSRLLPDLRRLGRDVIKHQATGFNLDQTTGTSGLAGRGFSFVLRRKNNVFLFSFGVNACVKVGSWNVFKLSLDADGGFASAPWFHFMGRGHVDKSNTRIADKCVTSFFIFIFLQAPGELRPQVCACPPSSWHVCSPPHAWLPI